MGQRYYSPELCRFIQPDSIEYLDPSSINGLNLYCYCINNPIMYADPSGHFPVAALIIGTLIGLASGGLLSGLKSYDDGNRGWELVGDIAAGALTGAALGASLTLGGLVGIGAITGKTIAISLASSTIVSFGAGMGSYALDKWTSNEEIKINEMFEYGGRIALESIVNFGVGYIFGAGGAWKSLNQGYFRINYMFNSLKGYNFIQNLVVSGIQVLQETYKQIIIRQVIKSIINLVV